MPSISIILKYYKEINKYYFYLYRKIAIVRTHPFPLLMMHRN